MSMRFDIQVARGITEIDQAAWDRLSGEKPFGGYRWYQFGEAAMQGCAPRYIVLSRSGEPVARAALWLKRREWLPVTSRLARRAADWLLERRPLLACEAPIASAPGLVLPEEPSLRAEALETIASVALDVARQERASFVIFGYIDQAGVRQPGWPGEYRAISYSDADTRLAIEWTDLGGWLRSLAQSTRRNYKLHCKAAEELGIRITAHPAVSDVEQALALVGNVERHHKVGPRPWSRSVLENAGLVDSTWIAAHVGERLLGCCSLVGDGEVQLATLLGLDYSFPQHFHVYYQVMYAAIQCAIRKQARMLYGGGGAYELKRRLGFEKLADDYLVLAGTGGLFKGLLRVVTHSGAFQNTDNKE
jgi:hypothetical protein